MTIEKKASSFIKRQFRRHRRPRTSRFAKSRCKIVVFETLVLDRTDLMMFYLILFLKVFRNSFSDAIPIFFNRLKSGFFPCPIVIKFPPCSNWLWIEMCENVVLSKIDTTMTTINKKNFEIDKSRIFA